MAAGTIRGIGAKTAQKIVALFHTEALDVLERTPEKLAIIPGISRKKALEIGESFQSQLGVRRLVEYLSAHGCRQSWRCGSTAPMASRPWTPLGKIPIC